jgi:hypothetical protein
MLTATTGDKPPVTTGLDALADRAWTDLDATRSRYPAFVPEVCAPVLYFGDAEAYRSSELRVVTVGLNPSDREFPADDPWKRFPGGQDRSTYLPSLNQYFHTAPLNWFKCFRHLLRGLGASFFPEPNTHRALHTDICSVVPTSPTWSRLPSSAQRQLAACGLETWHELIAELRPHVIVASVRYAWLDRIGYAPLTDWTPVHTVTRTNSYLVEGRRYGLPDGSTTQVVRGRAANTPFGTISNADRNAVGQSIRRFL